MNLIEIFELARQAGFFYSGGSYFDCTGQQIAAFYKLVEERAATKEREACAKVCEDYGRAEEMQAIGNDFAQAIRARGQA